MIKFLSFIKWFFGTILTLILIVLLVYGGLYVSKFFVYSEYNKVSRNYGKISGIDDNFVPQGLAIAHDAKDEAYFVTSGYSSKKGEPSRVYLRSVTNQNSSGKYVTLSYNNEKLTGHFGGIAYTNTTKDLYVSDDNYLYVFDFESLFNANDKANIEVKAKLHVNNAASFVFADEESVYVGEFSMGDKYKTSENHHFTVGDEKFTAIVSKYDLDKESSNGYITNFPTEIYSIRDKIQGFAKVNNMIYLSSSYGISSSYVYVHNFDNSVKMNEQFTETISCDGKEDGISTKVDHYIISTSEQSVVKTYKLPPMWEDVDVYEDRLFSYNESASDKYIFGKLFGANKYVSIPLVK